MKTIAEKVSLVALVSTLLTFALILTVIPMMGETIQPSAYILGAFGPSLIGIPVASICFYQTERIAVLNVKLEKTLSDLEVAYGLLAEKSRYDHMTGMLNRETFFAAIAQTRQDTEQGSLLIADADHFKRINDTYGHLTGDDALMLITDAIKSSVRQGDVVGRIGGEEFGVFLTGASDEEAKVIAERIRNTVEGLTFHPRGGDRLPLTVSIGGAAASNVISMSELMRAADLRLYHAKNTGRNRVVLDEPLPVAA